MDSSRENDESFDQQLVPGPQERRRNDRENSQDPPRVVAKKAKVDEEPVEVYLAGAGTGSFDVPIHKKWQKFPGPAGVINVAPSSQPGDDEVSQPAYLQQTTHSRAQQNGIKNHLTHQNPVWHRMLKNEMFASTTDSPSLLDKYNIGWAKQRALGTELPFKIPILAAAVHKLDIDYGLDPRGGLVDPTGLSTCCFHREFVERHIRLLVLPGTIVVLQNVTVFKQPSGDITLVVTCNNLVSIYYKRGLEELRLNLLSLKKDDVRRNAARLIREERITSRLYEQEMTGRLDIGSTQETQYNPGETSTQMGPYPVQKSYSQVFEEDVSNTQLSQFNPGVTSTQASSSQISFAIPEVPAVRKKGARMEDSADRRILESLLEDTIAEVPAERKKRTENEDSADRGILEGLLEDTIFGDL